MNLRSAYWALAGAAILVTAGTQAQSSRPGWGSTPFHDARGTGVTFRVWAPNATSVTVPGQFNSWSTTAMPLTKEYTNGVWTGVWSANSAFATPGQEYKYYLNGNLWKSDPRNRQTVSAGNNSIIYDPTAFNWAGDSLTAPSLTDVVVYELHIGTFYDPNSGKSLPGKFTDATNRLDYLKGLGVSAVEVLPIAEFPGSYSWGYNLSDPFAADNYAYGGPDGFKTFVKACHARGLAVLLDVVHNHYGPGSMDLWDFDGWAGTNAGGGIYFYQDPNRANTPYGSRPNYSRPQVASYIQDNFTMWLDEYHVDGFRWDTPGLMMSANDGSIIPEAVTLIDNITSMIHNNYPGKIDIAEDRVGYGFDSTWDTSFPYVLTPQLANTVDANRDMSVVANAIANNTRFNIAAGMNRVAFLESHDVVGDLNNGVRLVTAIDSATPNSYRARKLSTLGAAVTFTAPGVPMFFQGEEMLENQQFSASRPVDWTKTNTYSGIVQLYRDLIRVRRDLDGYTPGLKGNQCSVYQVDNANKLVAYRRWPNGVPNQDVVVVANFANAQRNNYTLQFPAAGNWYVHFNSDARKYSSDFGDSGTAMVTASGAPASGSITIGPYSALILSQAPDAPPQLTIENTNNVITIAWPNTYGEWLLSYTGIYSGPPLPWIQVPPSEYQTNASNIFVTIPTPGSGKYYRLYKP